METQPSVHIYFSEAFGINPDLLEEHGALDITIVNDLPLFIDPFLLFHSKKEPYQRLHAGIIKYLRFLRTKSERGEVNDGLLRAWYTFPEIKQMWLGYSLEGNAGSGLGMKFARALDSNLRYVFTNFGEEEITRDSHLEKLCLIESGIGKDNISDFTANLISHFLLEYTQEFALAHLLKEQTKDVPIRKAIFNYDTESWESKTYTLPWFQGDFIVLTPKDLLTKEDVWISREGLYDDFGSVVNAVSNEQLRSQMNSYFLRQLPAPKVSKKGKDIPPSKTEVNEAKHKTIKEYPELLEYYVRFKEDNGDRAVKISTERVGEAEKYFIDGIRQLVDDLNKNTKFYKQGISSREESFKRLEYLKDIIENKGGWRYFYKNNEPIRREADLQIAYRLVWYGTVYDVSREVDDGRGPADFKVSSGANDKTIVEFKLASNKKLKQNLSSQVEAYQSASDAKHGIKAIMYFTGSEYKKVIEILNDLRLSGSENIVLIDARQDNKPSGSVA